MPAPSMHSQIRTYFQIEAEELINRLTVGAAELTGEAPRAETVRTLERAAHTLKGAAHVVAEQTIARLAHDFEDELAAHGKQPSAASAERLVRLADELAGELRATRSPEAPSAIQPAAEPAGQSSGGLPGQFPGQFPGRPSPGSPPPVEERTITGPTVRVELRQTQQLLHLAGESSRTAVAMRQRLQAGTAAGSADRALIAALEQQLDTLERQLAGLSRIGAQLRLIPAESLLLEAGRMVRATAAALNLQVACVTSGANERIEAHLLEGLDAAMLHLLRNAIAHGVEPAAERRASGKPAQATIHVALSRNGNAFSLTCSDDGRGIEIEPIRAAALRSGVLSPSAAQHATREQLLALLFHPGFTTAAGPADTISGRGIGLDAVRSIARDLGGDVSVETRPGQGTTFSIVVPGTLFAVQVLEVLAGSRTFTVPFTAVEQTFLAAQHHITVASRDRPGTTLLLEDETMPYVRLQDLLPEALPGSPAANNAQRIGLVLRSSAGRAAVTVDSIVGTAELLVRPLPPFAHALPVVAGAALGPSGEPRIVLDANALVQAAAAGTAGRTDSQDKSTTPAPAAPILVIDDSMTTRVLEQSILEAVGYTVEIATSAEQALDMARRKRYALFLVDVEMPGMNGFEFVQAVRADPELRRTPSIMVTSLDSAESRERGRAAGAESYIVKGEFDQKIYLDRIRAILGSAAVSSAAKGSPAVSSAAGRTEAVR